jgi:hypothetical protein
MHSQQPNGRKFPVRLSAANSQPSKDPPKSRYMVFFYSKRYYTGHWWRYIDLQATKSCNIKAFPIEIDADKFDERDTRHLRCRLRGHFLGSMIEIDVNASPLCWTLQWVGRNDENEALVKILMALHYNVNVNPCTTNEITIIVVIIFRIFLFVHI